MENLKAIPKDPDGRLIFQPKCIIVERQERPASAGEFYIAGSDDNVFQTDHNITVLRWPIVKGEVPCEGWQSAYAAEPMTAISIQGNDGWENFRLGAGIASAVIVWIIVALVFWKIRDVIENYFRRKIAERKSRLEAEANHKTKVLKDPTPVYLDFTEPQEPVRVLTETELAEAETEKWYNANTTKEKPKVRNRREEEVYWKHQCKLVQDDKPGLHRPGTCPYCGYFYD